MVLDHQVLYEPPPKIQTLICHVLYDLISTSEAHREILYALFKKEVVPTNISVAMFSEKLKAIKECDAIYFFTNMKRLIKSCLMNF